MVSDNKEERGASLREAMVEIFKRAAKGLPPHLVDRSADMIADAMIEYIHSPAAERDGLLERRKEELFKWINDNRRPPIQRP